MFFFVLLLIIANFAGYKIYEHIFWYQYNPNSTINLTNKLEYYTSANEQSFNTILAKDKKFTKNTSEQLSFPSESDYTYVWIRVKVSDYKNFLSNHNSVLALSYPHLIGYRIFMPLVNRGYIDITNTKSDYSQALYPSIKLPTNISSNQYIYITFKWPSQSMNLNLWDYEAFSISQNKLLIYLVLNLAVTISFVIINVILYFVTFEKNYLLHSLYLFAAFLSQYIYSGVNLILFNVRDLIWALEFDILAMLFGSIFIYSYLKLNKRNKIFTLSLYCIIVASIAYCFAVPLLPDIVNCNIQAYSSVIIFGFYFVAIFTCIIKRQHLSLYYIFGIVFTIVALTLNMLSQIAIIPMSFFFQYICLYSSISFEGILFTLSIMDQIRIDKNYELYLKNKAYTDSLTKLKNRHYFNEVVSFQIANRHCDYAMMLFDLDFFKRVNDTYGHDVGDKVLVHTAELLTKNTRKSDTVFRWGGEEFIVILPDVDADDLKNIAENLRKAIELDDYDGIPNITVSIGATIRRDEETFDDWFKRTDESIYMAKLLGRNRVELGFNSPIFIQWQSNFESGNEIIDMQHRNLLNLSNMMLQLLKEKEKNSEKINSLYNMMVKDIDYHFNSEEEILASIHYPDLQAQKTSHKRLLSGAKVSENALTFDFLVQNIIGAVILNHLTQEDSLFFKYFKNNIL